MNKECRRQIHEQTGHRQRERQTDRQAKFEAQEAESFVHRRPTPVIDPRRQSILPIKCLKRGQEQSKEKRL